MGICMTKPESWLLNMTTVQESFKEKLKDCKAAGCSNSEFSFCEHFNKIYAKKWKRINAQGLES